MSASVKTEDASQGNVAVEDESQMPADLQAVTQAEEVSSSSTAIVQACKHMHKHAYKAYTQRTQLSQKLLQALDCSARVIDQLATIGGADPLQTSKDAERFLRLLKESHSLAASMAAKYSINAPRRNEMYADQLESHMLAKKLETLQQQLAKHGTDGMDVDG